MKAPDNLWSRLRSGSPEVYAGYFLLAQMIEEIAVLCRSGYLDLEDINNFIGSGLQYCICLLMPHIAWRRATLDKSRTNWANLIWLAETLPRTPVYAKRAYGL